MDGKSSAFARKDGTSSGRTSKYKLEGDDGAEDQISRMPEFFEADNVIPWRNFFLLWFVLLIKEVLNVLFQAWLKPSLVEFLELYQWIGAVENQRCFWNLQWILIYFFSTPFFYSTSFSSTSKSKCLLCPPNRKNRLLLRGHLIFIDGTVNGSRWSKS